MFLNRSDFLKNIPTLKKKKNDALIFSFIFKYKLFFWGPKIIFCREGQKCVVLYQCNQIILLSSSCGIPETGFGSSTHIPVLSVCFSCFYTGIWDLLFNAGSERLLERWLGNYTLGSLPLLSKRRRLKYLTAETTSRTGVLGLSGPTH